MKRYLAVLLALLVAAPAQAGWLDVPSTALLLLPNTWTQVQTFSGGAAVVSPLDVQYSSVLFDRFSVNSSGNLLIQATEKAPSAATAALAGAGAGNVDNGTHSYKVTFATAGGETDAGAVSGTVTVADKTANGKVSLSAIPTGSTFVTSRKVYRTAAGNAVTGPWLLLTTIADNTTTTYTDNTADASLTTAIPSTNTAIDTRETLTNAGFNGINTTSPLTRLTVLDTISTSPRGILSMQISTDTNGARVGFAKARGTEASPTTVVTGDTLGRLMFRGYDGSNYLEMASIEAVSTGTIGSTRVPTYLTFSTATDAAPSVLTERMRIDSTGSVTMSAGSNYKGLFVTSAAHDPVGLTYIARFFSGAASGVDIGAMNSSPYGGWIQVAVDNWGSQYPLLLQPAGGNVIIGASSTPASLLDLRSGDLTFSGANGQKMVYGRATELVAVGSGLATKATTIQIPADAVIDAVPVYVKTKPGGTATMTVTATTSGTAFQKGASISTNAGTSDLGNKNTPTNYNGTAAQTVTFTFDAPTTDALGEIRVNIYYHVPTAPTS